ncbi:MAG TPA: phosphodiesterase, partial [Pseudoxanthomonas sp.]|nr:phosphodiesterase [Pseudoxanthomonas sp.]
DVYDAITSDRPYKAGWDPAESLRRMASWQGHFDEMLMKAFVRSIGIYPIGALVRLSSDRLAVVVEQNPATLLAPRVRVFYSAKSRTHLLRVDVDLATAGERERIVGVESPAKWGFRDLEKLWLP